VRAALYAGITTITRGNSPFTWSACPLATRLSVMRTFLA
jgi:hypothetical protein